METQQSDHSKTSLISSIEQANERLAEKESQQQFVKERNRKNHLKRKELKKLAKENLDVPKNFALEDFIKTIPRKIRPGRSSQP